MWWFDPVCFHLCIDYRMPADPPTEYDLVLSDKKSLAQAGLFYAHKKGSSA